MNTTINHQLVWDTYHSTANEPSLGGIYSNTVRVYFSDEWLCEVSFSVEEGRTEGLLFASVTSSQSNKFIGKLHYCLGQFNTNNGAKLFSQFALNQYKSLYN